MVTTRFLVSNPSAAHVGTDDGDWVVAGLRPERVVDSIDARSTFDSVVERVQSLPGEYSLLRVGGGSDGTVRAYRGVTSSYDVYFTRRPDGTIVVGDHFRDVLSEQPLDERTVADAVGVDQLLFGARPMGTYVEEVGRLGHGERLEWPVDGEPQTNLAETLSVGDDITPAAAMDRMDRYFTDVLGDLAAGDTTATMLSGGVDSTLLHTYLDTDASVSAAFDSPEFEFEVDYARRASRMLGSDHELLMYSEEDYFELLEDTIDASGHPLLFPQGVMMQLVFASSSFETYVNGAMAGVTGSGTASLAYLAHHLGPVTTFLPDVTWEVTALRETAERIGRPATAPEGSAMNFRIHADTERVAAMVGRQRVDERRRERLRYTSGRVDVIDGSGYAPHMHLGHWIDFYHDPIATLWRHSAHANGKSMKTPIAGRAFAEAVLAVPAGRRYARFTPPPREDLTRIVKGKYLLKDLLERRLPSYETRKRKGHSQLPSQRYLDRGPLVDAFERYPLPDIVPEDHRESVRNGTSELTWYALNYAMWRDRVLENDGLSIFETTRVIER